MLDSDASFFLVPEFQSSRGARRTIRAPLSDLQFGPAYGADLAFAPAPHHGIPEHGTTNRADHAAIILPGANAVPTALAADDFAPHADHVIPPAPQRADDISPAPCALDDASPLYPPQPAAVATDAPASDIPDSRSVTPRRPMRFTFAREVAEPGRAALPIQNLFDGVFDDSTLTGPGIDPRLQRSRARAVARLAAHESSLPPEARNLFCDDGTDDTHDAIHDDLSDAAPQTPPLTVTATTAANDGTDGTAPRRAVRHLAVTRRAPRPKVNPAAIHDPLQLHLHQVRDALYAPDPEAEPQQAATVQLQQPALPLRLLAVLLTLAFTLARLAAPLRAVAMEKTRQIRNQLSSTLAGPIYGAMSGAISNAVSGAVSAALPRLPARATAIAGTVFLLAQTLPPHVM